MESGFFVMYIASTDKNISAGGSGYNFTLQLPRFLNFDPNTAGSWSVALSEITLPKRKTGHPLQDFGLITVECPEVRSASILNGGLVSVLRRVAPQEGTIAFTKWIYVPLQHSALNQLTVRLTFSRGPDNPLAISETDYFDQNSPSFVTLVFKRS